MEKKLTPAAITAFVAEMQNFPLISTRAHAEREFKNAIRREKSHMKKYGEPAYLDCAKIAANIRRDDQWSWVERPGAREWFDQFTPLQKVQYTMCRRAKLIEARLWEREAARRAA